MNEGQPSPGFDLPARPAATADGAPGATPAHLAAWLERVSADDPAGSAKRVLDTARILNRTPFEPAELLELTGLLDARAAAILGRIEGQMRALQPPLEGDDKRLAKTHEELLQELAFAQLRLVEEGLDQRQPSAPDPGRALRRALALTGGLCLHGWRLNQSEPEGTWHRIHRMLAVAEELGVVADPSAEDAAGLAFVPDSIDRVAARIGVLASSRSRTLQPGEMEALAHWIQSVPVQCTAVTDPGAMPDTSSRLWMSLDSDEPPSLIAGAPPAGDANARVIELQPVLATLRAAPPKAAPADQQGTEPLDKRLRKRWAVPLATQFNDGPAHAGPLVAVTGLFESHALVHADIHCKRSPSGMMSDMMPGGFFAASVDDPLGIPDVFKAGLGYREARDAMDVGGNAPPVLREVEWLSPRRFQHLVDTWESAAREVDEQADADDEPAAIHNASFELDIGLHANAEARPAEIRDARLTPAWLRNVGAGNVSLLLQAPTQRLYSGSLLAIRMADQEKILWKLGLIRWLRFGNDGHVSLGAEYLADACWPTRLHLIDYETPVDVVEPGFFFRDRGRPEVGVLLFAPDAFHRGAHIRFDLFGKPYTVTLKSIRRISHALSLGEFPNPLRSR
ncbi:hypothetical protein [Thioalkalivibrio sp.]|uniref:hypothetical protein n=1 Tax=Thioalkalivibrio sp. TaxID=2093813 RepID=UPI003561B6D0